MQRRLPGDYKTAKKANIFFCAAKVSYERRSLTDSGYFLMYRNVEYDCWSPEARHGRKVVLLSWWLEWEVPQGFWAALALALAYLRSTVISEEDFAW